VLLDSSEAFCLPLLVELIQLRRVILVNSSHRLDLMAILEFELFQGHVKTSVLTNKSRGL